MSRALILDFGGVISRTLFETHDLSEAALGLPPGSLTWRGPFAPDSDPLWRDMQAGRISERDYWARRTNDVSALTGNNWTQMSDFVRAARGADPGAIIRPEFRTAIQRAKAAGIKLAILSNELDLFYGTDFRAKLPFMADFDVIVDAPHTKILRPDPRAFQTCLDALNLPAAACVFVDDQRRNVDGARAIGLKTVHFDVADPATGYTKALNLLGLTEELTP